MERLRVKLQIREIAGSNRLLKLARKYASSMNFEENLRSRGKSEEVGQSLQYSLAYFKIIGSYGVAFKAIKTDPNDVDENGKRKAYAIKRIFPTINAAFILIEMLILKLLK